MSLLMETGMPSKAKVLSIFSITALALVEVTNSTSAHLDCLHTVTNRYSPVWMGPQKSMATSFQGSLGMDVMHSGSLSGDMLTTWHGWQCWMCTSTILSSPGNQTLVRRYSLVLVMPWWPSCASLITLTRSSGNYDSWTSDYQPTYYSQLSENGVILRPECSLLLRREVSSCYGFLQVRQLSVRVFLHAAPAR